MQQQQADGSYQELWPKNNSYTKEESLLPTTSQSYNLSENATPDEVFQNIRVRLNLISSSKAYLNLSVVDTNGNPLPNIKINGISDNTNNYVFSDSIGIARRYITANSQEISVSNYADIEDKKQIFSVEPGEMGNDTLQLSFRNYFEMTSTSQIMFSPNTDYVDVSVGGGGGGGAAGRESYGKGGGGGRYVETKQNIAVNPNYLYDCMIGAGGIGKAWYTNDTEANNPTNYFGGDGGTTSFLGVQAAGGSGGKSKEYVYAGGQGNGTGGKIASEIINATDGQQKIFSSFTEETLYGGGGGAQMTSREDFYIANPGSPGGGRGNRIDVESQRSQYKVDGKDGLGGGGGRCSMNSSSIYSGHGGSGKACVRIHLKS